MRKRLLTALTAACFMVWGCGAAAQESAAFVLKGLELGVRADRLTGSYDSWRDVGLRGWAQAGAHALLGELSSQRHFGERGTFVGAMDTYTFSPDWYGSLALGAGDGAFFLPRYRADVFLNRKWLNAKNLVTYGGAGYYRAPDSHIDRSITVGAIYYFQQPWIVEGGLRHNVSSPGSVISNQKYIAATYGRVKQDLIVARHAWGSEGYQAISETTSLVGFTSRETSLRWRHWFNRQWGSQLEASHYHNPLYSRTGTIVSLFVDFD